MQNVKGTADFFGSSQQLRANIQAVLEKLFQVYDFQPMDTAILNEMELLAAKYGGGEEILKEVYRLTDQGGRSLGLRYDLTLPFAKVLAMHPGQPLPFKRYEMGKVFRDGPVKKGRLREFIQCDADIAGVEGPEAEAELLQLAAEAFSRLDLPVIIRWNNRRFLAEMLEAAGVPAASHLKVMLILDKLDKIGISGVRQELAGIALAAGPLDCLLQLISRRPSFEELCAQLGLERTTGAAEVRALDNLLKSAQLEDFCSFDPFLSRGLSFYTGSVYEIFDGTGAYSSSLAAGGRYDSIAGRLAGNEDRSLPVAGISFGMEAIAQLLGESPLEGPRPSAIILPIGVRAGSQALLAASLLRENDIPTRLEYNGKRLKKSLAAASDQHIPYAILIGEDEVKAGMVKLKDLRERSEATLPLEAAILIIEKNTDTRLFA